MFDVLVYLYEHYWRPDACPAYGLLTRKLSAVGFEDDEICEALTWLDGLQSVSQHAVTPPSEGASRVYSDIEADRLGVDALGFLHFLESTGVLCVALREVVLERVLALPRGPVLLDDFKILVLLVFWSAGQEPSALILDELFVEAEDRVVH